MKKIIILAAALILPHLCLAQTQSHVVDTLLSKDGSTRYVLFDNHSWKTLNENGELEDSVVGIDSEAFLQDWSENTITAYHVSMSEIPDSLIMDLDTLGVFTCPYQGALSSHYGYRNGRRHTGADIPLTTGDPVVAAFSGRVRASMFNSGYGNLVVIRHANGMETYYAHLSQRNVEEGEWVNSGDVIGLGGSTGHSTGPHLHFEARYLGFPFDPERIVDFPSGELRESPFHFKKAYLGANSRYGVPDDKARAMDGMVNTGKVSTPSKPQKVYYKVKSGDSLSKIASKYHTTVSQLCKLNGIDSKKPIQIGKSLRVK